MCFSNTSLKLVPAQQCHTVFISVLSPSLALSLSDDRRANLKNSLHREVQSRCHYQFVVHDTATPKTSSGQMCTELRALVETAVFLLTGQIYAARSVCELLCCPQVQLHTQWKVENCHLSPVTVSYTITVSWWHCRNNIRDSSSVEYTTSCIYLWLYLDFLQGSGAFAERS